MGDGVWMCVCVCVCVCVCISYLNRGRARFFTRAEASWVAPKGERRFPWRLRVWRRGKGVWVWVWVEARLCVCMYVSECV
jgi:hypothetical protein